MIIQYTQKKKYINDLIKLLAKESKQPLIGLKNDIEVNLNKCQGMSLSRDENENKYTLNINDSRITSEDSVILLSVEIQNKLNFEKLISILCRKASN